MNSTTPYIQKYHNFDYEDWDDEIIKNNPSCLWHLIEIINNNPEDDTAFYKTQLLSSL